MNGLRGVRRRAVGTVAGLLTAVVGLSSLVGAQTGGAPPPTPVPPAGSPSPFVTTLRTPPPSLRAPETGAASAVLADLRSGQILFVDNPDLRRPVASLTKIMTALVVLERTDMKDVVTVSNEAAPSGVSRGLSELGLRVGEQISVRELSYALLLQSANDAADALAEHVSGSVEAFVGDMNAQAAWLGLADTRFLSPGGLDDRGYSTARDLVTLTQAAYRHAGFARIVGTQFHEIPSPTGEPRLVQNRNVLLWLYPGAIGVKTGFTSAAGFCVVAVAERDGRALVAVVLGASGEAFSDAAALLDYGFGAFEERALVEEGESFGFLTLGGRPVPIVARSAFTGLVPLADAAEPVRRVRLDTAVAFPPAPGEQVGSVAVALGGVRLGRVPLVVASVPPPPPPPPGPWWRRTISAVAGAVGGLLHALLG
ncbi:MAG: D-alanyl-D-alanine carboxypeptidase family protein [Actinomycetota bacterium]